MEHLQLLSVSVGLTGAQHITTGNFCPFPASVSPPCGKGEAGLCFAGVTSQSVFGRLHEAGVQYILWPCLALFIDVSRLRKQVAALTTDI